MCVSMLLGFLARARGFRFVFCFVFFLRPSEFCSLVWCELTTHLDGRRKLLFSNTFNWECICLWCTADAPMKAHLHKASDSFSCKTAQEEVVCILKAKASLSHESVQSYCKCLVINLPQKTVRAQRSPHKL